MDKIKASTLADLAYYSRFKPPSRLVTFAAPASTLTNFPALVKSNSTFHIGTSTGYDVHFQDLSGNELYFDLDYYDPVTGNGAWWVQIPSLPSTGPTSIKMLYGDSSVTTNGSTPATVWANYLTVYHFSQADPAQQFNSAAAVYDAWLTAQSNSRSVSLTSGGVTGQILSVNDLFHWTDTPILQHPISNGRGDIINFTVIYTRCAGFDYSSGARLCRMENSGLTNERHFVYGADFVFQDLPSYGQLVYMNSSWQSSDRQAVAQINDSGQSGTMTSGWIINPAATEALRSYSGASAGARYTYQIDEIRIANRFIPLAEAAYENNLLMHHEQYVTYGPEA